MKDLLQAIDSIKASGPDGISGHMLRGEAFTVTPYLTQFFNRSIIAGRNKFVEKFPKIQILNTSTKTDNPKNYRPISLLPVIGKSISSVDHMVANN